MLMSMPYTTTQCDHVPVCMKFELMCTLAVAYVTLHSDFPMLYPTQKAYSSCLQLK